MEVVHSNATMPLQIFSPNQKITLEKLQPEEKKIYQVKYASLPVGKLNGIELNIAARALLIKINVITGWAFPMEKEMRTILTDQFTKKLVESYPNVNTDEIEFAFRNYPVKEWGKNMNLNLIAEVLEPYLEKRIEVSRLEEQVKTKLELPAPEEKMSDEEFIEMNRNIYKGSKLWGLISTRCYDILKLNLSEGQKKVIENKCRAHFFSLENIDQAKGLSFDQQERFIKQNCKKVAVAEYFDK